MFLFEMTNERHCGRAARRKVLNLGRFVRGLLFMPRSDGDVTYGNYPAAVRLACTHITLAWPRPTTASAPTLC